MGPDPRDWLAEDYARDGARASRAVLEQHAPSDPRPRQRWELVRGEDGLPVWEAVETLDPTPDDDAGTAPLVVPAPTPPPAGGEPAPEPRADEPEAAW